MLTALFMAGSWCGGPPLGLGGAWSVNYFVDSGLFVARTRNDVLVVGRNITAEYGG